VLRAESECAVDGAVAAGGFPVVDVMPQSAALLEDQRSVLAGVGEKQHSVHHRSSPASVDSHCRAAQVRDESVEQQPLLAAMGQHAERALHDRRRNDDVQRATEDHAVTDTCDDSQTRRALYHRTCRQTQYPKLLARCAQPSEGT